MGLKDKTVKGAAWNGAGNIARQALQIGTLIVLAHFLSPKEFGVYAILMIFVGFLTMVGSMGTSQAVIHLDEPDKYTLSSILYFNIIVGILFFLLIYLASPFIASYFNDRDLEGLLTLMGSIFIIYAIGSVHKSMLEKSMNFKGIIIIETMALSIASLAAVIAAYTNQGIISLVLMNIMNTALVTVGFWFLYKWKPSLHFKINDIKQIWSYSINLSAFSIVNYFSRQGDHFLIGKYIGEAGLGIYSLAYKIMLYPILNISLMLTRVLFPAFSEIKNDNQRFKAAYSKVVTYISLITFPLMLGLMAVSENFVYVVFGEQWIEMASLLMILAPIGLIQSIISTTGSIYMAKGTTRLLFRIGVLNAVVTIVSFVIGIPYGINGVATAYGIANLLLVYPNLKFAWNQIDLGIFEGLKNSIPFLIHSIVMAVLTYNLGIFFELELGLSKITTLILQILTGVTIYFLLLLLLHKSQIKNMIKTIRKR